MAHLTRRRCGLNLLGLSSQAPGRLVYLSDGPNRLYNIGNYMLEFKKSALKDVGFKYCESRLIVQALKALGAARLDEATKRVCGERG